MGFRQSGPRSVVGSRITLPDWGCVEVLAGDDYDPKTVTIINRGQIMRLALGDWREIAAGVDELLAALKGAPRGGA